MKWIGLTGGIACGKSTAARRIRTKGWPVVDADELAHKALSPGTPVYDAVVARFGREIVAPDGSILRARLGEKAFANPEHLRFLEEKIHPWVRERTEALKTQHRDAGHALAFYDVPLLFEKNLQDQFDAIVVVACSEARQLERLRTRNGLDEAEARARITSQMPLSEKIKGADHVVYNDGTLAEFETAIDALLDKLTATE